MIAPRYLHVSLRISANDSKEEQGDDPSTEFAYVASWRRGVEGGWETTVSNDRNNVSPATRRMVKSKVQVLEQGDLASSIHNTSASFCWPLQGVYHQIRVIVKNIEKNSRDILMTLQNIHTVHHTMEENIIVSKYCSKAREIFGDIRIQYASLAEVVPSNQYYRYHDQWRFITQRLCFLVALVIYFEIKLLVDKKTVADILGVKNNREDGFHLDLEDFLLGLLQLSAELSRFAVNSVTNGHYSWPIEIATFVNELNAGFRLLNLKNDILRKRFDALKYDVKKIEEVVYDLCIRGLVPSPRPIEETPTEETPTE
ncbi:Translin [Trachymyrmex zeteki]|uniref:Translin n=1 Tax=Mycetomoellerius zeteki TaxID=64791 RepID=A0A151WZ61_9HYME|nr:Translin [Trachymyrmex zeteki]